MTRCAYHWSRRREICPGFKEVNGEWMCQQCYQGKKLEPLPQFACVTEEELRLMRALDRKIEAMVSREKQGMEVVA